MTLVKEIVDLYFRMLAAEDRYGESAEAKGMAVGLSIEFHELMERLRDSSGGK